MLEKGGRGPAVKELQLQLKSLGFDPGDIDGVFGDRTLAALQSFQEQYEPLEVTGRLDPETAGVLAQALGGAEAEPAPPGPEADAPVPCRPEIWSAFLELVDLITRTPVRYGPGRGLFKDGQWIVTYGPGALGKKRWKTPSGPTYPSFHCSSWTNFFLGWLLRYNERFTHAGNIPSLFDLCKKSDDVHQNPGGGPFRGYGSHLRELATTDDTFQRTGVRRAIDIRELHERRATLPAFIVCGQSSRGPSGWKWWHHTVLFAIDHASSGTPLYRLAADGHVDAQGQWSGNPMKWIEITEQSMPSFARAIYRGYGVVSEDGGYGGDRPIAPVVLEP